MTWLCCPSIEMIAHFLQEQPPHCVAAKGENRSG
jgi:hypothetical protein